jgi:uncharacterized protein (TIGR03792 family)
MGTQASVAQATVTEGMVVEELQFEVDPADREEFLRVEEKIWTGFLATCDGFVRKEVWVPEDDLGRVIVMIWWNTMEQWKTITMQQCDEVDALMGEWLRPVSVARAHRIVRIHPRIDD